MDIPPAPSIEGAISLEKLAEDVFGESGWELGSAEWVEDEKGDTTSYQPSKELSVIANEFFERNEWGIEALVKHVTKEQELREAKQANDIEESRFKRKLGWLAAGLATVMLVVAFTLNPDALRTLAGEIVKPENWGKLLPWSSDDS